MRLFLLPGVGHCGSGEGYDQVDLLTPLMNWTELATAPEKLVTGKRKQLADGEQASAGKPPSAAEQFHGMSKPSQPFAQSAPVITATRPVFPYPYIARYIGKGSVNDADNYVAVKSVEFQRLTVGKPASNYIGADNQKAYQVKDGKLTAE